MILPSDSLLEARRKLLAKMKDGTLTEEEAFLQALDLDPCDGLALLTVGKARQESGDLEQAQRYYWRGLEAHPCNYQCYFLLSCLAGEKDELFPLADGLLELALRKVLLNEEALSDFQRYWSDWAKDHPHAPWDFSDRERLEKFVAALTKRRTLERQRVVDVLRPYRLIHELQDAPAGGLDRELVDRILEYGVQCGPLLVGVLRGWVEDQFDHDFPAEASLALLGEIGEPAALPALLEFCVLDNQALCEAAHWAVSRIAAQRPAEAVEAFRKAVVGASAVTRFCLAEHLSMLPNVEGVGEALASLLEDLGRVRKPYRDTLFLIVATAIFRTQGRRGRATVLSALGRHSTLLARRTRAACRELLETFESELEPQDVAPEPPELSVYDICCWRGAGGSEDQEEDEEDRAVPPAAAQHPRPQRNEPCWCGSGKKYKKCHLRADEEEPQDAARPASWDPAGLGPSLRERLFAFAHETLGAREIEQATALYFGPSIRGPEPDRADKILFIDWLLHDYAPPRLGRSVMQEFLERNRPRLSDQECHILEQWSNSLFRLFEVQQVQRGVGIEVKDLLFGDILFVHDVSASHQMARGDCHLSRVEDFEGKKELSGAAVVVPRHTCGPLREWIIADRQKSGLPWPAYLRANSHRLRQKALDLQEQAAKSARVVSAEGDPLVL